MSVVGRALENSFNTGNKSVHDSESVISTATAVLLEYINRNGIVYEETDINEICACFFDLKHQVSDFSKFTYEQLDEILFDLLTDGVDLDSKKRSGSERTPDAIIRYMLDIVGYDQSVAMHKSIVDPACGTGTFIRQIVDRFTEALVPEDDVEEKLLENRLIRAYDTEPSNVFVTKVVIVSGLIKKKKIHEVDVIKKFMELLPVYCEDFLTVTEKADFIVGNPPYIRLQNLPFDLREYIKQNFRSATGRFDIFTCFMEQGDRLLLAEGKMCLITSNKYLTSNYGAGIRDYLFSTGHVRKIIDLFDTKFFGAAVLPAIILCENNAKTNQKVEYIGVRTADANTDIFCENVEQLFDYIEKMSSCKEYIKLEDKENCVLEISKSHVMIPPGGITWNFSTDHENKLKEKMERRKKCSLKDMFDVCVGIKTTADSVFVQPMTRKFVEEHDFEPEVIYPLI